MPIGFIRSRIALLRPLEVIGGVSTAVLGLIIFVQILMLDGKTLQPERLQGSQPML